MTSRIQAAVHDWQSLLGHEQVLNAETTQQNYGQDTSGLHRTMPAALRIRDPATLPSVLHIAQQHGVAVYPISTGRNWGYGSALPVQEDCVLIDLSPMNRILHFDADLGVVTVEPGVTQGMLADFLDAGGHDFMVPVTGAGPSCSLLGNALERGYGITPYTDHFGAVTDLEAVLADGSLYRSALREAGSEELARLFKWNLGPYTNGLFTQSGFGIVTRMSILLARRPECVRVCLFSLKDDALLEPAIDRIHAILSSLPGIVGGLNLMNRHRVLAMTAPYPEASQLDADGLIPGELLNAMGRAYQIAPWTGFASLYGPRSVVKAAQREIRRRLSGIASRVLFLSQGQAKTLARMASWAPGKLGHKLTQTATTLASALELVSGRPNETALPLAYWRGGHPSGAQARNPATEGGGVSWYAPLVPMRPSMLREYVNFIHGTTRRFGIEPLITFTSIGERLFDSTVPLLFDRTDTAAVAQAQSCLENLIEEGRHKGFHPYRLNVDSMPSFASRHPCSSALASKLRKALDPADLIAPGRYA